MTQDKHARIARHRHALRLPTSVKAALSAMLAGALLALPAGTALAAGTGRSASDATPEPVGATAARSAQQTIGQQTIGTGAGPLVSADAGAVTVTSGADSGPGTLRDVLAIAEAIPGTVTVTISRDVPVITLTSGVTLRGSVILAGSGATRVEGTWTGPGALLTVAGHPHEPADVTVARLTLAVPEGSTPAVSASSAEGPLGSLTVTDVAVEGGAGIEVDDTAGPVALQRIVTRGARAVRVSSVADAVTIEGLSAEGIAHVALSRAGSVVVRDTTVDAEEVSVSEVAGDVHLDGVRTRGRADDPGFAATLEISDVAGDVTARSITQQGPSAQYIGYITGSVTLTDLRLDAGATGSGLGGTAIDAVGGDVLVDGYVAEGITTTGLTVSGSPAEAAGQRVIVTGSRFVGLPGRSFPTGLRVVFAGAGGVEVSNVRTTQLADGVVLAGTGPVAVTGSDLAGGAGAGYGYGVRTSEVAGSVTLRDVRVAEFPTGIGLGFHAPGTSALMERVHVEVLGQWAVAGVHLLGESLDTRITDSTVRVDGNRVLQVDEWAGAGELVVERSTLEQLSAAPLSADATAMSVHGSVEIVNSTLVTGAPGPEDAANEAFALLAFRAEGPDARLAVRHSTLVGATALTMDGQDSERAVVDSSVLDATVGASCVQTHGPAVTVTRSALTCDVEALERYGPAIVLGGGNLIGLNATDLALSPLRDNGGPTQTLLPLAESVLIDAAGAPTRVTPPTDQRGHRRVQGAIDMGAVEVAGTTVTITPEAVVTGGDTAALTRAGEHLDDELAVQLDSHDGTVVAGTDHEPLTAPGALAVTGSRTLLHAGLVAALLGAGTVLFLVSRRRRTDAP